MSTRSTRSAASPSTRKSAPRRETIDAGAIDGLLDSSILTSSFNDLPSHNKEPERETVNVAAFGLDNSSVSNSSSTPPSQEPVPRRETIDAATMEELLDSSELSSSQMTVATVDLIHDVAELVADDDASTEEEEEDSVANRRRSTLSAICAAEDSFNSMDASLEISSLGGAQSGPKRKSTTLCSPQPMSKKPAFSIMSPPPSSTLVASKPTESIAPPSVLKSCLSARKIRPHADANRSVVFGSPEVAEFNKTSPVTSYTPLDRQQAKQLFTIPSDDPCGGLSPVDELTADNERVLAEWDRLTNTSDCSSPDDQSEGEQDSFSQSFDEPLVSSFHSPENHEDDFGTENSRASDASERRKTRRRRSKLQPILDLSEDIASSNPAASQSVEEDPKDELGDYLGRAEVSSLMESTDMTCTRPLPSSLAALVEEIQQEAPLIVDKSMEATQEMELDLHHLIKQVTARHSFISEPDVSSSSSSSSSLLSTSFISLSSSSAPGSKDETSYVSATSHASSEDNLLPDLLNLTSEDVLALQARLSVPAVMEEGKDGVEEVSSVLQDEREELAGELYSFMSSPHQSTMSTSLSEENEQEDHHEEAEQDHYHHQEEEVVEQQEALSVEEEDDVPHEEISFIEAKRHLLFQPPATPSAALLTPSMSTSGQAASLMSRLQALNAGARENSLAQCATPGVPKKEMSRSLQRLSLQANTMKTISAGRPSLPLLPKAKARPSLRCSLLPVAESAIDSDDLSQAVSILPSPAVTASDKKGIATSSQAFPPADSLRACSSAKMEVKQCELVEDLRSAKKKAVVTAENSLPTPTTSQTVPISPFNRENRLSKRRSSLKRTEMSKISEGESENEHPNLSKPRSSTPRKSLRNLANNKTAVKDDVDLADKSMLDKSVALEEDSFEEQLVENVQQALRSFHQHAQALRHLLTAHLKEVEEAGQELIGEGLRRISLGPQLLLIYPNILPLAWQHEDSVLSFLSNLSEKKSMALVPAFSLNPQWGQEWVQSTSALLLQALALMQKDSSISLAEAARRVSDNASQNRFLVKALDVQSTSTSSSQQLPSSSTTSSSFLPTHSSSLSSEDLEKLREEIESKNKLLQITNSLLFTRLSAVMSDRLELDIVLAESLQLHVCYHLGEQRSKGHMITQAKVTIVPASKKSNKAERSIAMAFLDHAHLMEVSRRYYSLGEALCLPKTLSELPSLMKKISAHIIRFRKALPQLSKWSVEELSAERFDWSEVIVA
eukprot:scaffold2917_cov170-Ochromonas_danica.AAC.10